MPHFDDSGIGTWICQVCTTIYNDLIESQWRPDITGLDSAGNVCPQCLKLFNEQNQDDAQVDINFEARNRTFMEICRNL